MLNIDRILLVVERDDDAPMLLEKTRALASAADASLDVVRVIYEGIVDLSVHDVEKNQALKTYIMQAEEAWLEDLVENIVNKVKSVDTAIIWHKDEWQGIIDAAEQCDADLIVKVANVEGGIDTVVHTPQDWNLLRHSTIPVMLLKPNAWVSEPVVLAAIDAIKEEQNELHRKVLKKASSLAHILGGELHLVCAYPLVEPWAGPSTIGIDFVQIKKDVEAEIKKRVEQMTRETGVTFKYLHIEEGKAGMVIRDLVEKSNTELLVLGTVGRTGVKGLIMGNTSEMILHHTNCDVVVLR